MTLCANTLQYRQSQPARFGALSQKSASHNQAREVGRRSVRFVHTLVQLAHFGSLIPPRPQFNRWIKVRLCQQFHSCQDLRESRRTQSMDLKPKCNRLQNLSFAVKLPQPIGEAPYRNAVEGPQYMHQSSRYLSRFHQLSNS